MAAHELFHVYARGIKPSPVYPWFEDPLAEWSTWKAGWYSPLPQVRDVSLQYPERPADTLAPEDFRYGMWRFVQFLDDNQKMEAGDGSWPAARGTITASPASTVALNQYLVSLQSSLGRELAEFWGQHLKKKPPRPPRLVPTGANSHQLSVSPGQGTIPISTCGICTSLNDFTLSKAVKRVEFEFQAPSNGYFWGLVAPNESRRIQTDESVSFCVSGADEDDLAWPGHFPVTFTNGLLKGNLGGTITIYAQTEADHCTGHVGNKACRVLKAAGAQALIGSPILGGFGGGSGVVNGHQDVWCVYKGMTGVVNMDIFRWRSSKELRKKLRSAESAGWRRVHLGDTAIIFEPPQGGAFLSVALGRQQLYFAVSSTGATSKALQMAQIAIPLVR
jgi:hypothetical protein